MCCILCRLICPQIPYVSCYPVRLFLSGRLATPYDVSRLPCSAGLEVIIVCTQALTWSQLRPVNNDWGRRDTWWPSVESNHLTRHVVAGWKPFQRQGYKTGGWCRDRTYLPKGPPGYSRLEHHCSIPSIKLFTKSLARCLTRFYLPTSTIRL